MRIGETLLAGLVALACSFPLPAHAHRR